MRKKFGKTLVEGETQINMPSCERGEVTAFLYTARVKKIHTEVPPESVLDALMLISGSTWAILC